jgi:hypothetical protein
VSIVASSRSALRRCAPPTPQLGYWALAVGPSRVGAKVLLPLSCEPSAVSSDHSEGRLVHDTRCPSPSSINLGDVDFVQRSRRSGPERPTLPNTSLDRRLGAGSPDPALGPTKGLPVGYTSNEDSVTRQGDKCPMRGGTSWETLRGAELRGFLNHRPNPRSSGTGVWLITRRIRNGNGFPYRVKRSCAIGLRQTRLVDQWGPDAPAHE